MNVAAVRRWQWMIVGILAGALCGYVRESSGNFYNDLAAYGSFRIGQREFEQAISQKFHGRFRFCELVITPHRLDIGGRTITLHVVSGLYSNGRTSLESGSVVARWEPAYFVASVPYVPVFTSKGPTTRQAATTAQFADVAAFLSSPPNAPPVPFEYFRWWWVTRPQMVWSVAGFVAIGLIWPTVINLIAFGTLLRPRESGRLSLWKVKPRVETSAKPMEGEMDVAAMETLENELRVDAPATSAAPAPPLSQSQVRTLRSTPSDPAQVASGDTKKKEFGAGEEDFYPTERAAKPGPGDLRKPT